jgi:hypothetical protein
LENPFGKKEKKKIRASEVTAAPRNLARCPAPARAAQASSERSNGGAHEGSLQRSPPEITLPDTLDQVPSGADETASQPFPPQVSFSPSSLPLRLSESFSVCGGQALEQEARGAIAVSGATGNGASARSLKDPHEKPIIRAPRKNPSTPKTDPPTNSTLIVHPVTHSQVPG